MKNNPLSLLPDVAHAASEIVQNLLQGKSRIIGTNIKQISPHISTIGTVIIKHAPKKSDYAKDLEYLVSERGLSVKDAAKFFNMSQSYAYELLRRLK